jgi:hypothetical protein
MKKKPIGNRPDYKEEYTEPGDSIYDMDRILPTWSKIMCSDLDYHIETRGCFTENELIKALDCLDEEYDNYVFDIKALRLQLLKIQAKRKNRISWI